MNPTSAASIVTLIFFLKKLVLQIEFSPLLSHKTAVICSPFILSSCDPVLSWQTSTEHMSPLLTAYDSRIHELEQKLAESTKTRQDDRGLIEQLNQKNQKLTSELQKSMDGLLKKMEEAGTTATGGGAGAGSEEWKEQLDERDDMIQVRI
jgi:uncharacterized coiled-coil protein SlyX